MRHLTTLLPRGPAAPSQTPPLTQTLTLTFDDRRRSRQRARLGDGSEAALILPRGTVLRDGDRLTGDAGDAARLTVIVRAAAETLSVARTDDTHLLARAAYHLGNRHVPLQIGPGRLAYAHDHVLDDLARKLGLDVTVESAPFEPEGGGYAGGHVHEHEHEHEHEHGHGHEHAHAPGEDGDEDGGRERELRGHDGH